MTNVRTTTLLQQAMSEEFTWRKKELHNIKSLVRDNEKTHLKDMCVRAAVTMLYAHWEGFVKKIGAYYLEFVVQQKMKNRELPPHFLALSVSNIVKKATKSSKVQPCLDIIEFFRTAMESRGQFDANTGVDTGDNLKSKVLEEIVKTLGLDYSQFATKEKLLDEKLVHNRNEIAHGKDSVIAVDEYLVLHGEIFGMMQVFYNQIDNSVITKSYRVP